MKPDRFLLLTFALSLALPLWAARPAGPVKGKKAEKTETAAPAPKKSPYEKFLEKKNLKRSQGGFVRLYLDGKKILAEIPDSLTGRKILLSSSLLKSSMPWFVSGDNVSPQKVFEIHRTDSLLLLTQAAPLSVVEDTSLVEALARSSLRPTAYAFPLQYRNADSTAFVVNVSKLFDPSNKDALDVANINIDARYKVYKATPKADLTRFERFVSFDRSVGVRQELTFSAARKRSMGIFSFASAEEDATVTGSFQTTLTLLPEGRMPVRKADPHVGVRQTPFATYRSDGGFRSDGAALRWDISGGKKITVYVDTLFNAAWQQAIRKGILAWNPAFEAIGLGRVIDVRPFPSYGDFSVDNPLVSTVRAGLGMDGESLRGTMLSDVSSGRILSCTVVVPADYSVGVREKGMLGISDVDARYATYTPSEEAVCEVLRAEMMRLFGRMLGLQANLAGSYAYSPAQLRNPAFTKVNGITASVLDDVLFNSLARPGDRQRGVVTIISQIGPYDRYAIEWLYREFPEGTDEAAALAALVRDKSGKREYLYVPQRLGFPDYRGLNDDLGSDVFAFYETMLARLKFVAANAYDWMKEVNLQEDDDPVVFLERVWLRANRLQLLLMRQVGGMAFPELESGEKYIPQPEAFQRACIDRVFADKDDFSWFDQSALNRFAGANTDYPAFSRMNFSAPLNRISAVAMAEKLGGSTLTLRAYLDLLTDHYTAPLRSGKLETGEETMVLYYIRTLAAVSPVLQTRYQEHFHLRSLADGEEDAPALQVPYAGVPAWCLEDLHTEAFLQLERMEKILASGRSAARTPGDRGRIDYLLNFLNAVLHDKK